MEKRYRNKIIVTFSVILAINCAPFSKVLNNSSRCFWTTRERSTRLDLPSLLSDQRYQLFASCHNISGPQRPLFSCFLEVPETHTVHLMDGSAYTIVSAATLRQNCRSNVLSHPFTIHRADQS